MSRLSGHFTVDASAKLVRHYRYAEERLMRLLGGWIALTPELPVKLLFGRHVWDCAQHADIWGRRLPELRAPAHQSEPPNDRFVRFMDLLESAEAPGQSAERLVGVYRVLKPHLAAAYAGHLAEANSVYEPPTRRILERCLDEERRHVAAGAVVMTRVLDEAAAARARAWEAELRQLLGEAGGVSGAGDVGIEPLAGHAETPRDLVPIPTFDPGVVEPALAVPLAEHQRAVEAGDLTAIRAQVVSEAHASVLSAYERLPRPLTGSAVIAAVKIGRHRVVKLRFVGAGAPAVMLVQWRWREGRWMIVDAEPVAVAAS